MPEAGAGPPFIAMAILRFNSSDIALIGQQFFHDSRHQVVSHLTENSWGQRRTRLCAVSILVLATVQLVAIVPSIALCRPPPRVEAPRVPASHVIVAGLAVPAPTPRPMPPVRGFWSLWQRLEAFFQRSMLRGQLWAQLRPS
eukprot:symbB.v1.2.020003.t1/scaffold1659.1/size107071/5